MQEQNKENQQQLNIELSEEVARGEYANLAVISHSSAEFVLDFISVLPGVPKANVRSRIIMSPMHAKRLLSALQDNINKFEKNHGEIDTQQIEQNAGSGTPFNFGGPQGVA